MLSRIDLTAASRPQLLPDESLLYVQNAVGLYEGKYKIPNYQNGCAYLTSHRACYVDNEEPRKYSVAVELKDVDRVESYAGFIKSSPKITLYLKPTTRRSSPLSSVPGSPRSSTPLIRPTSPPVATGSWVCPICSFSNPIPSNYVYGVSQASSIPPCLACGIRPNATVLDNVLQKRQQTPTTTPNPPVYPSSNGAAISIPGKGPELACPRCTFLNHPSLLTCELCGEHLRSPNQPSDRLVEPLRADSPGPVTSRQGGLVGETVPVIKFSFRVGGDKVFLERLRNALIQRKWLLQYAPPVPAPMNDDTNGSSGSDTPQVVGIAGLARKGITARKKNTVAIGGAVEDLEALMSSAKEMVALAESFATRLASTPSFAGGEANAALRNSIQGLGLVSKDMLGSGGGDRNQELYLSELARQIAEFLADDRASILKKEGGAITLVDLWAIYNRARGIDLISPSDLEKAARLFEKLKLPVRLRRFKSGLLVVQDARQTDAETIRKLLDWVGEDSKNQFGHGVTATETADRFGWSVGVAMEELEMAEEHGALCRDAGVEGIRFWKNFFTRPEVRMTAVDALTKQMTGIMV